ncbi:Rv3235 family protein [Mycobacterium sp. MYCO198283]|uniref:Rv3235 family protein n=1 Tax=Mycobacterium sp. MYCO198283 TaxID=2883505 RepID=UPI001E52EDD2|nr:Rv3235 family protein [Mycobacterium sp. MYCO198283]MCG5431604.1 Rv3235 family protein [Mycobacterium sp. MYCO198283]
MTSEHPALPSAVSPVTDYEPPPAAAACPGHPAPSGPHRSTARRRHLRHVPAPESGVAAPTGAAAAAFADTALRCVLEVLDRRRPAAQLRGVLVPGLVDGIVSVLPSPRVPRTAARLRRVRVRPADEDGTAAEVFATYQRGARVCALAGRVELIDTPAGPQWRLVALQVG